MAERAPLVASKLDRETIYRHLRLSTEYNSDDWPYIMALRGAAIEYICDHCAISPEEVDKHEDLAIAVLMLISDMYDRRDMTADNNYRNRTVETILSHHDRNFLGNEDEAVE